MTASDKTNFFTDVYEVVRLIPPGRATSYGAIARYLGTKGSARIVGWALNGIAGEPGIPAHRVLNKNGQLTGKIHFGTPDRMAHLLEAEGIEVKNNKVIHWQEVFWDPSVELEM